MLEVLHRQLKNRKMKNTTASQEKINVAMLKVIDQHAKQHTHTHKKKDKTASQEKETAVEMLSC